MISFEILKNKGSFISFRVTGHAGYAEAGEDIVCSAVSALAVNAVNSIERFTEAVFSVDVEEKEGGYLEFSLNRNSQDNAGALLLLRSLELGITEIEKEYGEYIEVIYKEVQ